MSSDNIIELWFGVQIWLPILLVLIEEFAPLPALQCCIVRKEPVYVYER